ASMWPASSAMVESVAGPDGTITQAARGAVSLAARSASESAASAPLAAAACRASADRSNATTSCPAFSSRSVMLAPIFPRPTMPILIAVLLSSWRELLLAGIALGGSIGSASILPRRSGQGVGLVGEGLQQLVEGLGERVHPFVLQHRRDVGE